MRWLEEEGSLRGLALFRVAVGLLVLRHAVPFVGEALRGDFFGDRFHVRYVEWLALPETAYAGLLVVMVLAGALVATGAIPRLAIPVAAAAVTLHFLLNQLWYSNNRIFLALTLVLLSLSPAPRVGTRGATWIAILVRAQLSFIYLASALSKLADPDWRSGDVLAGRVAIVFDGPVVEVLTTSAGRWLMGLGAIATELFLALGLWFRRTRAAALWVGVLFHVFIEIAFLVLVFSQLTLATYLLVPEPGERRRLLRCGRRLGRAARALDWLDKLEVVEGPLSARDEAGCEHRGWRALAVAGAALPLAFPFAWPLTLFTRAPAAAVSPTIPPPSPIPRPKMKGSDPLTVVVAAVAFWVDLRMGGIVAKGVWAVAIAMALTFASAAAPEGERG